MTGPQHYREAGRLLGECAVYDPATEQTTTDLVKLTAAQVHATLALAAATAYAAVRDAEPDGSIADARAWAEVTAP